MRAPASKRTLPLHQSLEREQAEVLLAAVGQKFFVAANPRVLVEILDAARAAPSAALGLNDVGAQLAAGRKKLESDRALGSSSSWWYFEMPPRNSNILKHRRTGC